MSVNYRVGGGWREDILALDDSLITGRRGWRLRCKGLDGPRLKEAGAGAALGQDRSFPHSRVNISSVSPKALGSQKEDSHCIVLVLWGVCGREMFGPGWFNGPL